MGIRNWLGLQESDDREVRQLKGEVETLAFRLEESYDQLNRMFSEDASWQKLGEDTERDLTPEGRKRSAQMCRVMAIANPLVARAIAVRTGYVHGNGGIGVVAADGKETGTQDVNTVVQAFLDDRGNRAAFTGAQAHEELEKQLSTDGNMYTILFTDPKTGFVRVRTLDPLEITDILMNPEDRSEPWFYRRDFEETMIGERTAKVTTRQRTVWYPALNYDPTKKFPVIDGNPVDWSASVYHTAVNRTGKFGLGDAHPALPWARGYTGFLDDWTKLTKALSRIAWKMSGKKNTAQQMRSQLNNIEAGGIIGADAGTQLEAVPKTGATIDAESGRPLATMVAAAFGIPVTTLMSDPGQTGARAVAETLNQPTRLTMQGRRDVWTETYRAILNHVIDQAVLAPQGPLKGGVTIDPYTQQREVSLGSDEDRTITFTWPELDDTPIDQLVKAITDADATGKLPPLETMRLLLRALGVRDVDEILDQFTDESGNFIDPNVSAGDAAIDAYNRGDDPAAVLNR